MITCFTGTGGSGKSLDAAREIYVCIRRLKRNVIANFEVNHDILCKDCSDHGEFFFMKDDDLTVDALYLYAWQHHFKMDDKGNYLLDKDGNYVLKGESQTLIVIDECQRKFNPRDQAKKDRLQWVEFFCEHRHWGFNVLLVTPMIKLIDQQISGCIEYDVRHRKLNNYAIFKLLPFAMFAGVTYWHGVREKIDSYFFNYKKRYNGLYNTFKMFRIPDAILKQLKEKAREEQQRNDVMEDIIASLIASREQPEESA